MSESLMEAKSETAKVENEKISTIGRSTGKHNSSDGWCWSELLIMFMQSNHH